MSNDLRIIREYIVDEVLDTEISKPDILAIIDRMIASSLVKTEPVPPKPRETGMSTASVYAN